MPYIRKEFSEYPQLLRQATDGRNGASNAVLRYRDHDCTAQEDSKYNSAPVSGLFMSNLILTAREASVSFSHMKEVIEVLLKKGAICEQIIATL